MTIAASTEPAAGAATISDDLTRIPYRLYRDASVYAAEQRDLFGGGTWNFLCLEAELPAAGSFRSTFVGETPVVITRDAAGTIFGFENRCAHRGALVCLEDRGTAKAFKCVYHAWSYNVRGDLIGVAFRNGIGGEGGMPPSFDLTQHGPRKLRIARLNGLVFGTFSDHTPDIETYLGPQVTDRVARVLKGREPVIIGRFTQMLPNNWKLYVENVKDSYHASILHLFFTTFEINRLSQSGGLIIDESGGNHVSYSAIDRSARADGEYVKQEIRSESGYRLADPSLLEGWDEFGDGITLQILSVFPGFVLQQIQNAIAVRQILPRGIEQTELNWTYLGFADDSPAQRRMRLRQGNLMGAGGYVSMEDGCVGGFVQRGIAGTQAETAVLEMGGSATESSRSRVTEASVRGFWKAYRQTLGPAL